MQSLGRIILTCSFLTAVLFIADESPAASDDRITEEIIIQGDRNKINLQLQVDRAEDEFYAVFNELVDEDLRIECNYETVLGSRIKQRICQTKYMRDELSTAAQFNFFGMEYGSPAVIAEKNRQLRNTAIELIENNPELRNAALYLSQRVEEYRDEYGIDDD